MLMWIMPLHRRNSASQSGQSEDNQYLEEITEAELEDYQEITCSAPKVGHLFASCWIWAVGCLEFHPMQGYCKIILVDHSVMILNFKVGSNFRSFCVWEELRENKFSTFPPVSRSSATTTPVTRAGLCTATVSTPGRRSFLIISVKPRRVRRESDTCLTSKRFRICGSPRVTILLLRLAAAGVAQDNSGRISIGFHRNHPATLVSFIDCVV